MHLILSTPSSPAVEKRKKGDEEKPKRKKLNNQKGYKTAEEP